jgi:hypothetical protein
MEEFKYGTILEADRGSTVSVRLSRENGQSPIVIPSKEFNEHLALQHAAYAEINFELQEAARALQLMQKFKNNDGDERILRRSLFIDAIMAYARAFADADGRGGIKLSADLKWLGPDPINSKRHVELIGFRNNLFGHTGNSPFRATESYLLIDKLEKPDQIAVGFQKIALTGFSDEDAEDTIGYLQGVADRVQQKVDSLAHRITEIAKPRLGIPV